MNLRLLAVAVFSLGVVGTAHGQPGRTPPGSTPPGPYPAPAPAPSPDPYPAPTPYSAPAVQPGYLPPPPAPRVILRRGWTAGFSFGIGGMTTSNSFECRGCESPPPAFAGEFRIGYMLSPVFALSLQGSVTSRPVDATSSAILSQFGGKIAGQFWFQPKAWLRLAAGGSTLTIGADGSDSYEVAEGSAFSAALGYEIMHTPRFGLDLMVKGEVAVYEPEFDEEFSVGSGSIGLGMNWY